MTAVREVSKAEDLEWQLRCDLADSRLVRNQLAESHEQCLKRFFVNGPPTAHSLESREHGIHRRLLQRQRSGTITVSTS